MRNVFLLTLLFTFTSWHAQSNECVQDGTFIEEITKGIDKDDLDNEEVSIAQLIKARSATKEQLACLENAINRVVSELEVSTVKQQDNKSLIDVQSKDIAAISSSINDINKDIVEVTKHSKKLEELININKLSAEKELLSLQENIDTVSVSLKNELLKLAQSLDNRTTALNRDIKRLEGLIENTIADLTKLSNDTSGNVLRLDDYIVHLVIAIAVTLVLLIISFFVSRVFTVKKGESILENLNVFKQDVQLNIVNADKKLAEILELLSSNISAQKSSEEDHSLALKVADEIVRIEKNTSRMDAKTKGLKQLIASVKRIQDNFAANGYEIVEMLNQPYDERMKASVSFVQSDELETDKQLITKVIKPQVNYKGVAIQVAQIEVSVGE